MDRITETVGEEEKLTKDKFSAQMLCMKHLLFGNKTVYDRREVQSC